MGLFDVMINGVLDTASGILSTVDDFFTHRRVRGGIERIQHYLGELSAKLDHIEAQNSEMLHKLDALPQKIRAIVQEIVDIALLNERYSKIRNIKDDIFKLNNRRYYRIRKPGWDTLSSTITYLFDYENRLSMAFRLLDACELAMVATKGKAAPFIYKKVDEKNTLIKELRDAQKAEVEHLLTSLKSLLDNSAYISSHNLSNDLGKFDDLTFAVAPDRNRTETRFRQECRTIHHRCEPSDEICHDIPYTVTVPDTAFNQAKRNHVARINALVGTIRAELSNLANLQGIVTRYDHYLTTLGGQALADETVVLFYEPSPLENTSSKNDVQPMEAEEKNVLDDYFADISDDPDSPAFKDIEAAEDSDYFETVKRIPFPDCLVGGDE